MMNEFKKLMLKKAKEGKFLSDEDKAAKLDVLNGIKEIMGEEMGKDLKGIKEGKMQKVTVASPTPEGLKEGLEKAEDVVEGKMGETEDSEMEDEEEMPVDSEEMSKEAKIKKLEEELAKLKGESVEAMC